MNAIALTVASLAAAALFASPLFAGDEPTGEAADKAYVLDHEMERIDGEKEKLADYEGKVVLMVNVASRCGYTRQYAGLEKLYKAYKDRGLVVMGFPANDFGRQEPGSNDEILEFCTSRFEVTFPMFAKVSVKGDDACALYKDLAKQDKPIGGEPRWNFTKFLVDHTGRVVERFEPGDEPDGKKVMDAVERRIAAAEAAAGEG